MVETEYLRDMGIKMGEGLLAGAAREKKATAPRLGSGLDALLEADPGLAEAVEPEKARGRGQDRSRSPRRGRETMGQFLAKQVAKHGDADAGTKKKKKKVKRRRTPKGGKGQAQLQLKGGERLFEFSAGPSPGGQRALEDSPKETRAAHSLSPQRNDPLLSGQDRGGRSGVEVGWTESHSVLEPDYSRSTSSSESGGENGPGTADTSSNVGPHPGRAAPASHGYAPSALQSMRDEFMGKQLGDCPPLGDYPPEHGVPRQDRGARARHTARAEGGKAQGKPAEDRKGIGTRQRARPALGKAREPTKTGGKPTSDTPTVFRKERQPSPADEGPVTFDEEGIRRQEDSPEARGKSRQPREGGACDRRSEGRKRGVTGKEEKKNGSSRQHRRERAAERRAGRATWPKPARCR